MGLFKKAPSPHQTTLAMVGARPGDRVLVAGRPDPGVVAELARTTGLNGQTLLAVATALRAPYQQAADNAGVLVEHADAGPEPTALPDTTDPHDVVVLHFDLATLDEPKREALAARAMSLVRSGGRIVVIEGRGVGGWFSTRTAPLPADAVMALLHRAGGLAVRPLGHVEGVSYFEARKSR
jgi:hypothetical protein